MPPCIAEFLEPRWLLSVPVIDPVADVVVSGGKTLVVPLTAFDADGDTLSWTVTSTDESVITVLNTPVNPTLRLDVQFGQTTGTLVFELFHDLAPHTVDTIMGLANGGYYDGQPFYQVVAGTYIQGGDTATQPPFYFDDEFNPNLIFTGAGQLAMVDQAGKDRIGTKFFVTAAPLRKLDFKHPIFGQLVRGQDVLDQILALPVDANYAPIEAVTIVHARFVPPAPGGEFDTTAAAVVLKAVGSGSAGISIQVSDGQQTAALIFQASVQSDTVNDPPLLGPLANVVITPEQLAQLPVENINGNDFVVLPSITLPATDLEGNPFAYASALLPVNGSNHGLASTVGGIVTVKALQGYTGPIRLFADVFPGASPASFDKQEINIAVGDYPISATPQTLGTMAGQSLSSAVVAQFSSLDPNAAPADFTTYINWGDGTNTLDGLGQPLPSGSVVADGGQFSVRADHTYPNPGFYPVTVTIVGKNGACATANSVADIQPATPPVAVVGGDAVGVPFQPRTISLGATDVPADMAEGFQYIIDWRDGTAPQTLATGAVSASHVFRKTGKFSVRVIAIDHNGTPGDVVLHAVAITPAVLEMDPGNSRLQALFVGGTSGNDLLRVAGGTKGTVKAYAGNKSLGAFAASGGIYIYAGDGNDHVEIDSHLNKPAFVFGGKGNDTLLGGPADDILVGGNGNDVILGNAGRDLLIGGNGADVLLGGPGQDILVADATALDEDLAGLLLLRREWQRTDQSHGQRVNHLLQGGGRNGSVLLSPANLLFDSAVDALAGTADRDLFFADVGGARTDRLLDSAADERVVAILR
jgi:cyclophilin family peptidyl-prolyl cis-trans isomerase